MLFRGLDLGKEGDRPRNAHDDVSSSLALVSYCENDNLLRLPNDSKSYWPTSGKLLKLPAAAEIVQNRLMAIAVNRLTIESEIVAGKRTSGLVAG